MTDTANDAVRVGAWVLGRWWTGRARAIRGSRALARLVLIVACGTGALGCELATDVAAHVIAARVADAADAESRGADSETAPAADTLARRAEEEDR